MSLKEGQPQISFIFITANRCAMLLDALASTTSLATEAPSEILVTDNGSTDDTAAQVKAQFPDVRYIQLPENKGVAGGRNYGVEQAQGEILIFIDDDALLESRDIIDQLASRFAANPKLAVVAFKIINDQANAVLSHEFPMRANTHENIETEQPVSYFVGCGFAARRQFFIDAGGFYPDMFYGLEELDLSYRLLDLGYDILYCPDIVVRHRTPPAVRRQSRWYYNLMRSRVMLVLRNLPWWVAVPHLILWQGGLFLHALRHGHMDGYFRGLASGWRMAPQALSTRRSIRFSTARRINRLSGRLFY